MESNSKLIMHVDNNSERMSSVTIDVDTPDEFYNNNFANVNTLQVPLKGILRNPNEKFIENSIIQKRLIKLCFCLFIIVLITPITFCDIYFGFNDTSCSTQESNELAISLKVYLLVSGFISFSLLIGSLVFVIYFYENTNISDICILGYRTSFSVILIGLFSFIWNILGAIVFWAYIYGNDKCNKTFSTYVFVSLIIKILSIIIITQFKNNKK